MSEPDMQMQIREYVMNHVDEIKVSGEIQKRTAHHMRVVKYHLTQYGINIEKLQPLASYADFVLGSTNSRLINEFTEGLETKFVLRNGEIALA